MVGVYGEGSEDALLSGRSQAAAELSSWLGSLQAALTVAGKGEEGMNHQMAEKRHFHSYDPTDVGGAERLQRKQRRQELLKTALSAHWSSGSPAKGQHSERCPPLARHTEHMYPWHDSASEELHSRVKELTFKEQAAWFPSVSCTWYSPAAPGKQVQSSVFPCQAHMQWNSLILIASLH